MGKWQCVMFAFLSDNDIGTEGAKYIAEGLKVNSTLQTLNLRSMPPTALLAEGFWGVLRGAVHWQVAGIAMWCDFPMLC